MKDDLQDFRALYSPIQLKFMGMGIRQAEIARRTKMSPQYVSALLQGDHWPSPPTIRSIAGAVGLAELDAVNLFLQTWDWAKAKAA